MNHLLGAFLGRLVLGLTLLSLAAPSSGPAPSPAQGTGSSGAGIFLTRAEEADVPGSGRKIWVPTTDKIRFGWSDTPFAIHIPWKMETEIQYVAEYIGAPKRSQIVAKDYDLRAFLKGFAYQDRGSRGADSLNVLAFGLGRPDGQKVYLSDRDVQFPGPYRFASANDSVLRLKNLELAPNEDASPVRLGGRPVAGEAPVVLWIVVDPRPRDESVGGSDDVSRSHYSMRLDAGLRHWPAYGEQAVGRIVVKLDAREGEPAKMTEGPLADSPQNKKPRTVLTAEAEIVVKQNGWALAEGKATKSGDWSLRLNPEGDTNEEWHLQDTGTNATVTALTSTHRLNGVRLDNPDKGLAMTTDVSIRLDLPRILWDHQPSEAKATVSVVRKSHSYYSPSRRSPHGLIRDTSIYFEATPLTLAVFGYSPEAARAPQLIDWYDLYGANASETNVRPITLNPMRGQTTILTSKSAKPDGTLPQGWTADQKLPSHKLLALDIRFFPGREGLPPAQVPTKHVEIPATRRSDLDTNLAGQVGAAAPTPPAAEPPSDDYYEWLAEFTTKTRPGVEREISEIKATLTALAALEENYVQEFATLLCRDQQAFKGLAADKDLLDHLKDQILLQRDETLFPTETRQALAALSREREEIRTKKAAVRPAQDAAIADALRSMKSMIESVEVKGITYNALHPEHKQTISELKDRYDLLKLELYDAAKLYEGGEFEQLMSEVGFGSVKDQELRYLLTAKAAFARARAYERRLAFLAATPTGLKPDTESEMRVKTAKAEAYRAALAVLKLNPENAEAKSLRKSLELSFISAIMAKLETEKKASLLAFGKFFEERGFSSEESWWPGFLESPWVWMGMGPVSSILGWAKKIETEEATDFQQTAIAKNHVALLAVRKLVANGMSLPEIRTITPAKMELGMSVETVGRSKLKPEQIQRFCRDIHETFIELGDLRALAEADVETFSRLHPKAYYNLIQPDKSRVEFWSDFFFSPMSVIGWFGPHAITKVEGTWRYFRLRTTADHIALLDDLGEVQRASQWFSQVLRLEAVGSRLAKLPGSGALARAVAQDAAYVGTLSSRMQFINGGARAGARLGGSLLLFGGLFAVADASNIPALKILCNVIATMGTGDLARGFFAHAGVSFQKAEEKLGELAAFIVKKKAELAEYAALAEELEKIRQRAALRAAQGQRGGIDADTVRQIEALIARHERIPAAKTVALDAAPGILPDKDRVVTFKAAAEALKQGNLKQAESAIKGLKNIQAAMTAEGQAIEAKLAEARNVLRSRGEPPAFQHDPNRFKPIMLDIKPEDFALRQGLNPNNPIHAFILEGDNAVRKGDFEAAETLYRAGKKLADGTDYEPIINDRLDLMLCGRDFAKKVEKTRAAAAPSKFSEPMRETDQQLADKFNRLTPELKPFAGGKNKIFQVKDSSGKVFMLKRVDDPEEIYREVVSTALYNHLGGKAPTARHIRKVKVPVFDEDTNRFLRYEEVDGIVYNFVDGKEVGELTEPEILALKKELAALRAFRLWLCDTDGHMRNFKVTAGDEVSPLDFGFAHLRRGLDLPQFSGFANANDQKQLMGEAMRINKRLVRARDAGRIPVPPTESAQLRQKGSFALYGWIDRLDGMLSYDDMAEMVRKIEKISQNRSELERVVRGAFGTSAPPEEFVAEAVEVLTTRGSSLGGVLKSRFAQYFKEAGSPGKPRPRPAPRPQALVRPKPVFPNVSRLFGIPWLWAAPLPMAA